MSSMQPLLIVGATEDHTVPASVSKAQYKRYARSPILASILEDLPQRENLISDKGIAYRPSKSDLARRGIFRQKMGEVLKGFNPHTGGGTDDQASDFGQ